MNIAHHSFITISADLGTRAEVLCEKIISSLSQNYVHRFPAHWDYFTDYPQLIHSFLGNEPIPFLLDHQKQKVLKIAESGFALFFFPEAYWITQHLKYGCHIKITQPHRQRALALQSHYNIESTVAQKKLLLFEEKLNRYIHKHYAESRNLSPNYDLTFESSASPDQQVQKILQFYFGL